MLTRDLDQLLCGHAFRIVVLAALMFAISTAVRNVDPALHQRGVGFSIVVSDDSVAQTILAHEIYVETAHPVVVPVKPNIVVLRHVIISEVASAAAKEHSRA